nr:MAG TPA: hypothetical protein [Caudoviricetes sp.]
MFTSNLDILTEFANDMTKNFLLKIFVSSLNL